MAKRLYQAIGEIRPLEQWFVLLVLAVPGSDLYATSCRPVEDQLENSAIVIEAMARRVEFEPEHMETPEVAKFPIPVTASMFDQQPGSNPEITVEGCMGSDCFTWTGTRAELPAIGTVPWFEVDLDVKAIWKGSVGRRVQALFAGGRHPIAGEEYIIVFSNIENGYLTFRSPCQAMLTYREFEKYSAVLGDPVLVYE